ncbi:hypothetical protein BCIN_05g02990 [Botrytis cinerea B05.10]|uniref:Uncharacterized protein n=2 Tax=Botryotinia fuckeliana TaxID=40559 RepID=A0A384JHH7_BOTFB|nr:hypothetical protein BCIN_05g02990 [Botrytis cinerea B05.10]ATZ49902.1 hypothetical protein BCIN_05g02990 [Botrytis cinerea B05.10]
MDDHNGISYDEYDNTQNNYTYFPPGYIPPNNPPSQDSYSDPQSQQPSQPRFLEFPQQQPLEEGQESPGQRNCLTSEMRHQPQAFIQQQLPLPSQYLMTQPPSRPQSYSSPPIQSSQLQ